MDTLPSHMFCSKHSDCEAPISVITKILSENDPIKFENISNEFEALGFTKVKDLAQTTFGKASSIKLSGDSSTLLYKALEMYDKHLDDLQTSAKLENQNGNFIKTQQICEELLQQKPNDFNVITLMAESFFKCRDYEKSISFFNMAINLNPNCFQTLLNIASNYRKQSKYDLAKYYILEAIKKSPYFNHCWIYYAEILIKTNDLKMAEYAYCQYLNVYPDSNTVRNNYGKLLLNQNKIKNAKEQFKIVHKSGETCETLSNLGDVYFMVKKFDKAISNYHKALELNPKKKYTLVNLGMVYIRITEYQKAIDTLVKATELYPKNVPALKYLAVAYCNQNNTLMSVETFKKCLKLVPEDLNINLELGRIYYHRLDNLEEAEHFFEKCIQLNQQREDVYKNLLVVYQQLNKPLDASNICMTLGDLYLNKLDLENARNAFTTAIYLNPENVDGHWKLGLTMHKLGRCDLAIIRYMKAHEMTSNFAHP